MSLNLRYPNINAPTEKGQIAQIHSFLRYLVDQLNYGLPADGETNAIEQKLKEIEDALAQLKESAQDE